MNTWKCFVAVLLVLSFTSGCVIRPEGVMIRGKTKPKHWNEFEAQLLENRESSSETGLLFDEKHIPGVIVIGRTGPYRNFENRKTLSTSYTKYRETQEGYQNDIPILSYRDFENAFDGWTTISVANIPMLGSMTIDAFVRKGEGDSIGFSSVAGAILISTREDLVAAKASLDTPYYVIEKLLCEDGKGYRSCAKEFDLGVYDGDTGRELGKKYVLKEKGKTIDMQTYKVIR